MFCGKALNSKQLQRAAVEPRRTHVSGSLNSPARPSVSQFETSVEATVVGEEVEQLRLADLSDSWVPNV